LTKFECTFIITSITFESYKRPHYFIQLIGNKGI
jgi:hypothetical protein